MPNNNKIQRKNTPQQSAENQQLPPDAAKIMYDALVKIAHSDAFFSGEKRLVRIAQQAIEKVTNVK